MCFGGYKSSYVKPQSGPLPKLSTEKVDRRGPVYRGSLLKPVDPLGMKDGDF